MYMYSNVFHYKTTINVNNSNILIIIVFCRYFCEYLVNNVHTHFNIYLPTELSIFY